MNYKLGLLLATIVIVASILACSTPVPQLIYTPYPTQVPPTPYLVPTVAPTPYLVPTVAPVKLQQCAVGVNLGGAMFYMGATGPLSQTACSTYYNNVTSDPTLQGIVITKLPYLPKITIYCENSFDGGATMLYVMSDNATVGVYLCNGAGWPLIYSDGG